MRLFAALARKRGLLLATLLCICFAGAAWAEGLDIGEHGMHAYDIPHFTTRETSPSAVGSLP